MLFFHLLVRFYVTKTSLCFTNQAFYVRNIFIHSYTMNKITVIIATITIIIIIIIIIVIINFNFPIIFIIIIITMTVIMYLNSCVFCLTTCFLLFIDFRCNILQANIFIDLLLLALGFFNNFSTFNKEFLKFIMCYNFNYRLVLDLYSLFQSFWTVFITQKLGFHFKYQLDCIVACVIIIKQVFKS